MMVLGILNICFAGLGLLGALYGLIAPFLPLPGMEMMEDLYKDSTYLLAVVGLGVVGVFSKVMMAASGVGLVQGKAWGRTLGNFWALFSMLYGLVLAGVNAFYVQPKTFEATQAWMQSQPGMNSQAAQQQAQMMQSMEGVMVVMALVMGVFTSLVYQLIFLFLNNRKAVRDYLASRAGGGDGYEAQPYGGHPSQEPAPPSDSPW